MDCYAILGIPKDADQATIRDAYRILARRYHPDMGTGSSTEQFRRVTMAYEALIDPARRQAYDRATARQAQLVRIDHLTAPVLYQEDPAVFGRVVEPSQDLSKTLFDGFIYFWVR